MEPNLKHASNTANFSIKKKEMLAAHLNQFLHLHITLMFSNMQFKTSKKKNQIFSHSYSKKGLPQRLIYFDPGQRRATFSKLHCTDNFRRRQ